MACNSGPEPDFKPRKNNSDPQSIKISKPEDNYAIEDSVFKNVWYIKPEATKNSLIGEYDKIISHNDTIFILEASSSQQAIFAFRTNGDFLFKINARGRGPGEYRKISDFYIDAENAHIGILGFSKILKYSFKGEYIEEVDLREHYVSRIAFKEGLLYGYTFSQCPTTLCYALKVFDTKGKLLYEDYPQRKDLINFIFRKEDYFAANSQHLYLNLFNSDTIYSLGENSMIPKFVLDFGKYKIPDEEFEKMVKMGDELSIKYLIESDYVNLGANRYAATDDYLFFSYDRKGNVYDSYYSIKTEKTRSYRGWRPSKSFLLNSGTAIGSFNDKSFYSVLKIDEVEWLKRNEEFFEVHNSKKPDTIHKGRLERYNTLLKGVKLTDNNIIAVFELRDF